MSGFSERLRRIVLAGACVAVGAIIAAAAPARADDVWLPFHTEAFEQYPVGDAVSINGRNGWTTSSPQQPVGNVGWYVGNNSLFGGQNQWATGNFLLRGHPFSSQGQDWATLHVTAPKPLTSLSLGFTYELQGNERGKVEISGNGTNWVDITSHMGITPRYSNDQYQAAADVSSMLNSAGVQKDVYIRFNAWNPSGVGNWHWFAVDNISLSQKQSTDNGGGYTPPGTPPASTKNLREWNGSSWVPIAEGSLTSGNVHVLVHGWGPGQLDWTKNNPGKGAWDNTSFFTNLQAAAQGIRNSYQDPRQVRVLAFSWLDKSATPGVPLPNFVHDSRAYTDDKGLELKRALVAAGIGTGSAHLQLLGHSHGARVASEAAIELENQGIQVDHLTLWDSPETSPGPDQLYKGGFNNLGELFNDPVTRGSLTIGAGAGNTFIDNYSSEFGVPYAVNSMVNVRLQRGPLNPVENHGYPVGWYADATSAGNGFALAWSPLKGNPGTFLFTYPTYYHQTASDPLALEVANLGPGPNETGTALLTNRLTFDPHVVEVPGGLQFTEASSAFWDAAFNKNENNTTLKFTYQFLDIGDGDQLGIWIDDQLRFLVTGELAGTRLRGGVIDISDLDPGSHLITASLHSYGATNAQFFLSGFTVASIPEPASVMLLAVAGLLSVRRRCLR